MGMIDKELDSSSMTTLCTLHILLFVDFAFSFLIKLYQEQSLILNRREQVMFPNKIKDVRSSESQEVRKSFSRLSIDEIQLSYTFKQEWIVF
jgi:hypothetical protein